VSSADEELRTLQQKRIKNAAADRRTTLLEIAKLERQFPGDYRFPYERAKLSAKWQARSNDAAFQALFLAAQRAIRAGKAQEMLQGLQSDRAGAFRKLAQGHVEWAQLVQSLKSRDVTLLAADTNAAQAATRALP
jgi:ABC-type amino acid transport substrate-binding protein